MATSKVHTLKQATFAVGHGGVRHPYGATSPPIFQTAQFEIGELHTYTRVSNPTTVELENRVASLEGAEYAVAFSSGMAAIAAMTRVIAQQGPLYLMQGGYAGTTRLCHAETSAGALDWRMLDRNYRGWEEIVQTPATVWFESPTNPFLDEVPISDVRKELPNTVQIVVDNTFATPVLQRPLEQGATHVVHSASKFLGGHSDVIAGVVVTNDAQTVSHLRQYRTSYGGSLDPFAAWLVLRGIQTLYVRMMHSAATADILARMLSTHLRVEEVYYPGLSDPSARPAQMTTGGAVVTFRLKRHLNPKLFIEALRLVKVAESLGGVESLINQSVTMSHASLSDTEKQSMGLDSRVFRLSVGLEDPVDLLADLTHALEQANPNQ